MHVIFLCPHFPANQRHFVRGLKRVGARVTGLCDARLENIDHEVRGLLDDYEYVPNIGNLDALTDGVRRIQQRGPWVHRFEATVESHMLHCAAVRERTKIPGTPWEVVERCRDKFLMKQFLRERGIPCARNAAVSTPEEALAFAEEVGYPLILKPRDGAGASGTHKVVDEASLWAALREEGLDSRPRYFTMEEFIVGHEGFFDTLTVGGKVVFEAICHYYPGVLEAMRTRDCSPQIVSTNRIDEAGYAEVRKLGRKVVGELGLQTSPTHMEWFYGPKGLSFSEIGARPPGCTVWDIYCQQNDLDLYTEWARAVCYGDVHHHASYRQAGGLVALRPDRDGTIRGYEGVEEAQRRYGKHIFKAVLPPPGSRTQPVEAGYLANAYVFVSHPDYDACRAILDDIGELVKVRAG